MLSRIPLAIAVLGCVTGITAAPHYQDHPERAAEVKAAFQRSWNGYYENAFPHDTLRPISKSFSDDRYGLFRYTHIYFTATDMILD